jgi:hypothetical protein
MVAGAINLICYLMVSGAIDWNICPLIIHRTSGQIFQFIAPATIT